MSKMDIASQRRRRWVQQQWLKGAAPAGRPWPPPSPAGARSRYPRELVTLCDCCQAPPWSFRSTPGMRWCCTHLGQPRALGAHASIASMRCAAALKCPGADTPAIDVEREGGQQIGQHRQPERLADDGSLLNCVEPRTHRVLCLARGTACRSLRITLQIASNL